MHIYFLLLLSLTTIVKGGFVEDCKAKFVAPKATDDAYNLYCPKSDTCGDGVRPSDLEYKESSGFKTAEVAGQVLDVIDFAKGFLPFSPLKSIADVGLGVFNFFKGSGGSSDKSNIWVAAQMQNDISKSQDYIVCKMAAMNGQTLDGIQKLMGDDKINGFNESMKSFIGRIRDNCLKWSCLKYIQQGTPPSQRQGSCSVRLRSQTKCAGVSWNPVDPVPCTAESKDWDAICDDGLCYEVVSWETMKSDLDGIMRDVFGSESVKDYTALDSFNDDISALALAKGSLVKLLALQQYVMLGSPGSLEDLQSFLLTMVNKLEKRYNSLIGTLEDAKRTVNLLSFGNSTHFGFDPCNEERIGMYETDDALEQSYTRYPIERRESFEAKGYVPPLKFSPYFPLLKCAFRDNLYGVMVPFSDNSYPGVDKDTFGIKSSFILRMSCEDEPEKMEALCPASKMTGKPQDEAFNKFQCGPVSKATDRELWDYFDDRKMGQKWPSDKRLVIMCYERSLDKCWSGFVDLLNPGGACNEALLMDQTQAVNDYAQRLWDKKKATLAPVKQVIDKYQAMLAIGGMDISFLRAFQNLGYPDVECVPPSEAASIVDAIDEEGGLVEAAAQSSSADLPGSPLFWGIRLLNVLLLLVFSSLF